MKEHGAERTNVIASSLNLVRWGCVRKMNTEMRKKSFSCIISFVNKQDSPPV